MIAKLYKSSQGFHTLSSIQKEHMNTFKQNIDYCFTLVSSQECIFKTFLPASVAMPEVYARGLGLHPALPRTILPRYSTKAVLSTNAKTTP
jgi:hypothetical protein